MKIKSLFIILGLSSFNVLAADHFEIVNAQNIALKAHLYSPSVDPIDGEYPAIVMMHGCAGAYSFAEPNDNFTNVYSLYRQWGERLADAGYKALLIDSFTNRGDQVQCGNGSEGVSEVDDRPLDALAAYQYLVDNEQVALDKVGLLGWSHGGSSVISTLSDTQVEQPFAVGVSFYPGCGLWDAFGGISTSYYQSYAPLQVLNAELDNFNISGHCQKRRGIAAELGNDDFLPIIVYPGAEHSFDYVSNNKSDEDVRARVNADGETLSLFYRVLQQ